MKNYIESLEKLQNSFTKLGGVGSKTALRYAYSVINMDSEQAKEFAENILRVKNEITFCEKCGNFTDTQPCYICANRQSKIVAVVAYPKDVNALEKVKNFECVYHVLHGVISPLNNKGPNDIRIKELLQRVNNGEVEEVVLALNPDVEGEATAMYIAKLLKPLGVKVSRLAQGMSMGSELEFADEVTLTRALEKRSLMWCLF